MTAVLYPLRYVCEVFTGIRDEFKVLRLIVLSILIFGFCTSVSFYYKMQDFKNINIKYLPETNIAKSNNNRLIERAETLENFRVQGQLLAEDINNMGANLFAVEYEHEDAIIETPPEMSVKAKILSGENGMIILNVAGNNGGLTLKAGDTFMNGRGRVVKIDKELVLINFDGNNIEIR